MKKIFVNVAVIVVAVILTGCVTTMNMNKSAATNVPDSLSKKTEPDMEFIGFKADANILSTGNGDSIRLPGTWTMETYTFPSEFDLWKSYRNDTCLKNMGSILQNANVAYDQSFAYFGIYSLQELELYKSRKRFVTFIEVDKNRLSGTVKDSFTSTGAIVLGTGIGLLGGGAIWVGADSNNELGLREPGKALCGIGIGSSVLGAILLAQPAKTTLNFEGVYQIYVYDTQAKEIVYKDAVTITESDVFSGSYFNEGTDKNAVNNYYATLVYNEILKKYASVDQFINQYKK